MGLPQKVQFAWWLMAGAMPNLVGQWQELWVQLCKLFVHFTPCAFEERTIEGEVIHALVLCPAVVTPRAFGLSDLG